MVRCTFVQVMSLYAIMPDARQHLFVGTIEKVRGQDQQPQAMGYAVLAPLAGQSRNCGGLALTNDLGDLAALLALILAVLDLHSGSQAD